MAITINMTLPELPELSPKQVEALRDRIVRDIAKRVADEAFWRTPPAHKPALGTWHGDLYAELKRRGLGAGWSVR